MGSAMNDYSDDHDHNQQALNDKITWQSKVFGSMRRKCFDYIIMDSRSSARTTTGMMYKPPVPGDHYMIGAQTDLMDTNWNAAERQKRDIIKPIGWSIKTYEEQQKWSEESKWSDEWNTTWTMQDMDERIMKQTHCVSATRPAFTQAWKSTIKQKIDRELRREDDQGDERNYGSPPGTSATTSRPRRSMRR